MNASNRASFRFQHRGASSAEAAFTLTELAVVLAVVVLAVLMLLPALAHTQPQTRSIQCLNNLRQMQVGWRAYASDSADLMLPNAILGQPANQTWDGGGSEDWGNSAYNVNPASYLQGLLAAYIGDQIGLYRCPGDTIPSANGQRLRSYSMNGQMGNCYSLSATRSINPSYLAYVKVTDLVGSVSPALGMVFLEENMSTLNDGYLQMNLTTPGWSDLPGSYHNGAMGVSFADGHVELHQWTTATIQVPVRYGYATGSTLIPASGTNPDWRWYRAHAAAPTP